MNENFVESWMDVFQEARNEAMNAILAEFKDALIITLSVPVSGRGKRAIRSAPGEPPRRDTGELIASIEIRAWSNRKSDRSGFEVVIRAKHAIWLENGTERMAARPFVAPMLEEFKSLIVRELWGKMRIRIR